MTARDLVTTAIRDAYTARSRTPPDIADADLLPKDARTCIEIVERVEVLRDGRQTTRLYDAWRCRTVADLVQAVEAAYTPGACGICREPLVNGACVYCGTRPRPEVVCGI